MHVHAHLILVETLNVCAMYMYSYLCRVPHGTLPLCQSLQLVFHKQLDIIIYAGNTIMNKYVCKEVSVHIAT